MDENRKRILKMLRRQKVTTIGEVAAKLDCVVRTAQRRFKEWNAFRSCNKNGKFYTLPEILSFDDNGLWRYEGMLFSQHGNLKDTITHLVKSSTAGLASAELESLTWVAGNNPIIYQLRDAGQIRIAKVGSRIALFDADSKRFQAQQSKRTETRSISLPKCEDGLIILVEMIKNPGIELMEIAKRLRKVGRKVSESSIQRFLDHHGLSKKNTDTS